MIFITQCESSAFWQFWQTYLSDPASTTMEGILFFNKHSTAENFLVVLFFGKIGNLFHLKKSSVFFTMIY
jgi:hypothetical protein